MRSTAPLRTWVERGLVAAALLLGGTVATPAQADAVGPGLAPPDGGAPVVSSISVEPTAERITGLTVTLTDVQHPWADDLDVVLVGPTGAAVVLASDAGMGGSTSADVTFDDAATEDLPVLGGWSDGAVRPTDHTDAAGDDLATALGAVPSLLGEVFDGSDPSGTWTLHVVDDTAGGIGSIGGWSLQLTTELPASLPDVRRSPADVSVLPGIDATFTASATGHPAPTVRWESSPDGRTWTALPGEQSRTLTLPAVVREQDQLLVRARFANRAGTVVTAPARLTVVAIAPQMTQQPADVSVLPGSDVTFGATAYGDPAPSIEWRGSYDGELWFRLPSGQGTELLLPDVDRSYDGLLVRARFSNLAGGTNSRLARVTVRPVAPSVTAQPTPVSAVAGEPVTFAAAAEGDPAPRVRWRWSRDGGSTWFDVPDATTPTLELAAEARMDGWWFVAEFSNAGGMVSSQPVVLSVEPTAPVVVVQPFDQAVREGRPVTFAVDVSGDPAPDVRWQRSRDGGETWIWLSGDSLTLTFRGPRLAADGTLVRAVISNRAGEVVSEPALLTVRPAPPDAEPAR